MLLQSQAGGIEFLPALPAQWQEGSVRGLCARGGFVVDMQWANGRLETANLTSRLGGICRIISVKPVNVMLSNEKVSVKQLPNHLWQFNTQKGGKYIVSPAG